TSSQEWADETKSALGSQKPLTPALPSAASTPGHDFPGAYPGGSEEKAVEGTASGGGGILETAKQYIPDQEDVGKALSNATETAKQYLPQAVVSYFRSGSQMGTPPIVTPTANTKTMGVGDLPGPPSEENVAMLPEER
ncbi:hypothetical protein EDD18DRAFT_1033674, partial [Armillaria luteobubalina]